MSRPLWRRSRIRQIVEVDLLSVQCTVYSSIGQNIKSHAVSGLRSPMSVLRPECEKTSNGHNSATRHPIDFVFGSRLGFLATIALFNLTAHELHELNYDRPTS